MAEKVNPYLRPLYDALHDMLDFERVEQLRERGQIEVAPLAFMRGRTLNDAFVILDEAQNTTSEQMRMFLTRLGYGSKAVVTGDVTQTDLPHGARSGLREARDLFTRIEASRFASFTRFGRGAPAGAAHRRRLRGADERIAAGALRAGRPRDGTAGTGRRDDDGGQRRRTQGAERLCAPSSRCSSIVRISRRAVAGGDVVAARTLIVLVRRSFRC
jgi:hypothetical protein